MKTYTEIRSIVKQEIDTIKKRDGELPPGAYIVVEVATRLKTLTPWEGYDKAYPLAKNLRKIVEDVIQKKPNLEAKKAEIIPLATDAFENLHETLFDDYEVGRSVDSLPSTIVKREKLKKKLKKVG